MRRNRLFIIFFFLNSMHTCRNAKLEITKPFKWRKWHTFCRRRTTNGTNVNEKYNGNVFLKVAEAAVALWTKHDFVPGWIMEHGMIEGCSIKFIELDPFSLDKYMDRAATSTAEPLQLSLTALYTGSATGPVFKIKSWYDLGKLSGRITKAYITWTRKKNLR